MRLQSVLGAAGQAQWKGGGPEAAAYHATSV